MAGQVQRQTGVALWRQIADRIRQAISAGAYDETGMVPPETLLAQQFGVNRHTVRSAIAALAQEGIVRAVQGRGTLIERKERLNFPITRRTRFTAGIGEQARAMRGLLLGHSEERADEEGARWLKLRAGAPVIRMETVRKADDRPVSFCYSGWETESHWDVSIDTLEGHRRRGLGTAACVCLIRHFAARGKTAVWGALDSNPASTALAEKLGFTPIDHLLVAYPDHGHNRMI